MAEQQPSEPEAGGPEQSGDDPVKVAGGLPADAQPTRLNRSTPEDKSREKPDADAGPSASSSPGLERDYADGVQAGVTNIYVVDQRNYGVYAGAGGTVRARKVTGQEARGEPAHGRLAAEPERHISAVLVSETRLLVLRQVRIASPDDDVLAEVLAGRRLAILQGPDGSGKSSAALSALGLQGAILNLDPSVTVSDLSDFGTRRPLDGAHRYVVESLSPTTAQRLNSFVLRSLEKELSSNDGRLVITVDSRVTLDPDISGYIVPWASRPEPAELLRRHLDLHLTPAEVDGFFADDASQRVVEALATRSLRDVDETARRLARLVGEGHPVAEAIELVGLDATARVRQWFAQTRSVEDLAFLMATAVLGGCRYSVVSQLSRRLARRIARGSRQKLSRMPVDPLRTRTTRVEDALAVLETGAIQTEFGLSPAETIRLENGWLVRAVLDVVHHEYDVLGTALYGWLEEIGRGEDADVRLRAAGAIAWLAQYDFAAVRRQILLPWALGTTLQSRAAAEVLGIAAWLEPCSSLALALTHHWATQRDNHDLWWTAAVAYGGELGMRFPGVAMDSLHGIVTTDHAELDRSAVGVVSESAFRLVRGGGRYDLSLAGLVLEHLAAWLDSDSVAALTARRCYALALVWACDLEWRNAAELRGLLVHDATRPASARLLRATLAEGTFRADVLESLEELIRSCDVDDSSYDSLAALLIEATTGDGSRAKDLLRLRHYLNRWSSGRRPSPSARRLLDRLPDGETA